VSEGIASRAPGRPAPISAGLAWRLAPIAVGLGTLTVSAATLGSRSLSTDEAAALAQADRPWPDVLHAAAHDDPSQGSYLLILKLISHYSTSEAAIRTATAVAIAVAAALMVVLGTHLLGHVGGAVAGIALGANAGVIDVAREARPYAIGVLAVVASTLAFTVALQRGGAWRWVLYAILAALLPLTHPLAASALLAQGAALAACRDRTSLRRGGIALGVGAAFAAVLAAWMAADRLDAPDGIGPLDLRGLGAGALHGLGWSPVLAVAAVAGLIALFGGRTSAPRPWAPVLTAGLIVAPATVLALAAIVLPVSASPALVLSAPGIALATGAIAPLLSPTRGLVWAGLALLLVASAVTIAVRLSVAPDEDWQALATAVKRVRLAQETVVVVPERSQAAFTYYAPDVSVNRHARGDGAWIAVVAGTPSDAIERARPSVHTPTYALLRQFSYGNDLRLQHWVRP
jgi:hypothetical protein